MTNREKCAGGIVICPFVNDIYNYEEYRILIVKQKYTNFWGLPKGHIEENENVVDSAKREITEETGLNLYTLSLGEDYDEVNVERNKVLKNMVVIKKIYFFVYVLLKDLKFVKIRSSEIVDVRWISLEQLKKSTRLKLNRTLCLTSLGIIENICLKTRDFLVKNYDIS